MKHSNHHQNYTLLLSSMASIRKVLLCKWLGTHLPLKSKKFKTNMKWFHKSQTKLEKRRPQIRKNSRNKMLSFNKNWFPPVKLSKNYSFSRLLTVLLSISSMKNRLLTKLQSKNWLRKLTLCKRKLNSSKKWNLQNHSMKTGLTILFIRFTKKRVSTMNVPKQEFSLKSSCNRLSCRSTHLVSLPLTFLGKFKTELKNSA